jgi:signal transduction histidine kinase
MTASGVRANSTFNLSQWFAIVGLLTITAVSSACAFLLSQFLTDRLLRQEGVLTTEFVQSLVLTEKTLRAYFTNAPTQSDAIELEAALRHIAAMPDVLRANIYNASRILIWSSDQRIIGRKFGPNPQLDAALGGEIIIHRDTDDDDQPPRKEEHVELTKVDGYFVEIYVPVRDAPQGKVIGAVELYKNPKALAESLHIGQTYILLGAALSGLFLYLSLFWLSRRADTVIRTQRERLVETEILATIGEMGSAVAHGIRNPLAAIRSSAELSLEGGHELAVESARDIIAEADRLEQWVRSLLSYTRPFSAAPEAVALQALVSETLAHFARDLERREILSKFSVSNELPLTRGDPLLLRQVLHSLLANAVEAIEKCGTIEIAGTTSSSLQRVELTIRDSGPGMTAEQLARAFTPFYTTKPKGLGVGLALAKRIVERFGGRIVIDSAPGRGTSVSLSMPIA